MGFSAKQSRIALDRCAGNVERAVDWLFNHADDMMDSEPASTVVSNLNTGRIFAGALSTYFHIFV